MSRRSSSLCLYFLKWAPILWLVVVGKGRSPARLLCTCLKQKGCRSSLTSSTVSFTLQLSDCLVFYLAVCLSIYLSSGLGWRVSVSSSSCPPPGGCHVEECVLLTLAKGRMLELELTKVALNASKAHSLYKLLIFSVLVAVGSSTGFGRSQYMSR